MAEKTLTTVNKDILTDLRETDPKYNEEVKKSQSRAYNPFGHDTRELFSNWFVGRHDAEGHLNTAQWDHLDENQTIEFDNYVSRQMYESGLKEKGYGTEEIALMRKWDADMKQAALNGTYDKLIQSGELTSQQYMDAAVTQYNWDEAMFGKYVATARTVANTVFDPDGDGIMNVTADVLRTLNDFSKAEIAEMYSWLTPDQKRMMQMDGVHDSTAFAERAKTLANEQYAIDNVDKPWYEDMGDFFKGIGAGFLEGVAGLISLPTTLFGLAVGVFAGWDNPVTKWTTGAAKTVEEGIVGNYKKAVDYDEKSKYAKVGGWVGQAAELAAEMALTAGASAAIAGVRAGVVRGAEKVVAEGAAKVGTKAFNKASAKLAKNSAKLIEREAMNLARKTGARKVNSALIDEAVRNVSIRTGVELTGSGVSKAVLKSVEEAATTATVRLARRGMLVVEESILEGMSAGARKEFLKLGVSSKMIKTLVAKEGAEVGAKEATKAIAKKGAEAVAEKANKELLKEGAKKIFSVSGFVNRTSKISRQVAAASTAKSTEVSTKMLAALAKRPSWVNRTTRSLLGNTDGLTKLFAVKAFTDSLDQSRIRGYNGFEALARSTVAAASTNVIWGKMRFPGHSGVDKMYNAMVRRGASVGGAKVASWFGMQGGAILDVGAKMLLDGQLQNAIIEGWGQDLEGNDVGFFEALKKDLSWKTIGEKFLNALVMHSTTVGMGGIKASYGKIPMVERKARAKNWEYINKKIEEMDAKDKPWEQLWNYYKDEARKELEKTNPKAAKDEGQVYDYAAAKANAEGHTELTNTIVKFHIEHRAVFFGHDMNKTFKTFEGEFEEDFTRFNAHMAELEKNPEYNDLTPEQKEFFRMAFLHKLGRHMKGIEDIDALAKELGVEAYDPQDFAIAMALFSKENGTGKKPTMADMERAFKKVDKVKKLFTKEIWDKMTGFSFSEISYIADQMLNLESKDKTQKYVEMRLAMKELLKKHGNERTHEFKQDFLNLMRKYDWNTIENNREIQAGNPDAQNIQADVEDAEGLNAANIVTSLNNGEEKSKIVDDIMTDVSRNGDIKTADKPYEALKRLKDAYENPPIGQKMSTAEYHDLVTIMFDRYSKFEEYKGLKKVGPAKEYRNIAKANKVILEIQKSVFSGKEVIEMSADDFQSMITNDHENIKKYADWLEKGSEGNPPVSKGDVIESIKRITYLRNNLNGNPEISKKMAEYFGKGSINGIKVGDLNKAKAPMEKINKAIGQEEARMGKVQKLTPDIMDELEADDEKGEPLTKSKETVRQMKNSTAKMALGGKNKDKLKDTVDKDGKVC